MSVPFFRQLRQNCQMYIIRDYSIKNQPCGKISLTDGNICLTLILVIVTDIKILRRKKNGYIYTKETIIWDICDQHLG